MRLIAGLAIVLSALGFATGAFAHASLISTEPSDGSMLSQAPKTVRLRFNEPVRPAAIKLIDGEGRQRDDATVSAHDDTVVRTLALDGDRDRIRRLTVERSLALLLGRLREDIR